MFLSSVSPPREVYVVLYLRSPTAWTLTFALGPDDGAWTWLDGDIIQAIAPCQGTVVDAYKVDVTPDPSGETLASQSDQDGDGVGDMCDETP